MDGFRILEITQPSELHVTANQLTIEQQIEPKKKKKVSIPIEQDDADLIKIPDILPVERIEVISE